MGTVLTDCNHVHCVDVDDSDNNSNNAHIIAEHERSIDFKYDVHDIRVMLYII